MMRRDTVISLIDNRIIERLQVLSILEVKQETFNKASRFSDIIKRDIPDININKLLNNDSTELNKIDPKLTNRIKYCIFYINHCYGRVNDLEWMLKNRIKFNRYDNQKLFRLLKFKESFFYKNIIL
jgi:hypothetical protein